jgi:tetratricopeptide (TPR) repeat protein
MSDASLTRDDSSGFNSPNNDRLDAYISALLLLITALVYWPVTRHEFINYDDPLYVTENQVVQDGLSAAGVQWAFVGYHASNWHPVTWLSHMIDASVFALDPGGHHLTNLLLHLANTFLLFWLLRKLTGARWRCAAVAALFAWHPLHVESVAWVAERKDVLSTLFLLLCLWAYVTYTARRGVGRYLMALGLFALGLMSKPMLVTLPCLLLLLDYWPLGRLHLKAPLIIEKIPFFALSFASCLITFSAQHSGGAVQSMQAMPLLLRLDNAFVAYAGYLRKMFWPMDLAIFYPLTAQISPLQITISIVILAAVSFAAWHWRRQRPYLVFGWLWYVGTLVPVIGLIQVGSQSMADRYTYVPLIGVFIMVAWALAEWASHQPRAQLTVRFVTVMSLSACLASTCGYVPQWQSSHTLFEHAVKVMPNNFMAYNNLGAALKDEGKIAEATSRYLEAVRLNPDYSFAHFNLAMVFAEEGRIDPALYHFSQLERLKFDTAEKHNLFGIELAKQGRLEDAVKQFSQALRRDPNYARAHCNLAYARSQQGQTAQAIDSYREALRLRPQWPEALQSLAWLLATDHQSQFRNGPEAIRLAEKACDLTAQKEAGYLDTLAAAYAEAGWLPEAVVTAERALQLAKADGKSDLFSEIQCRLQMYQNGEPFRQ